MTTVQMTERFLRLSDREKTTFIRVLSGNGADREAIDVFKWLAALSSTEFESRVFDYLVG